MRWWSLLLFSVVAGCGMTPDRAGPGGGAHADASLVFGDGGDNTPSGDMANCLADTFLTGTVVAPNGQDPVPGAFVFVPDGEFLPDVPGAVTCDLCQNLPPNVTQAKTDVKGHFKLANVPTGDITVVIQLGRFRRVVTVHVDCGTQSLKFDAGALGTRLPRKNADWDPRDTIPKIAVVTGDYDEIECVLHRMGLAQMDLYDGRGGAGIPATVGAFQALVTNVKKLLTYNVVIVNCSNNEYQQALTDPKVRANLANYVAMGGRIYATDWAYDMVEQIPEFSPFMCFEPQNGAALMCSGNPMAAEAAQTVSSYNNAATVLDPTLKQWLANFPGVLNGNTVNVAYSFVVIDSVSKNQMKYPSKVWLQGATNSFGVRPMTVTFDYNMCGRVHYSTFNTEPAAVVNDATRYPNCVVGFSPQERVLEYLIFEIASCVGPIPG